MAPKYKLTYFNLRGRAEAIRFMFAYKGVEYEDERHERGTDSWKSKAPFGQLPILEVDGKVFAQSNAIGRYVARELGLDGKTSLQKLEVDMVIDTMEDMMQHVIRWFREEDPARKEKLVQTFCDETVPKLLGKIDEIIAQNGGFTASNSLSYSDFVLAVVLTNMSSWFKDLDLSKYPNAVAVRDMVHDLPGVKEWVQRRPDTPF